MGHGASNLSAQPPDKKGGQFWVSYCRSPWRTGRVRQLDEFLGLQRPPLKRGLSSSNLEELVRKLTQEPVPIIGDGGDDNTDLRTAIAKLNAGGILHTEKRAIERLLAQRYEEALAAAALVEQQEGSESQGGGSDVLRQVLLVFRQNNLSTELDRSAEHEPAEWRVRTYRARRRALLVVRSMVRLKREVKRLGAPFADLGWLLPVAAQERWGHLKALAATYKRLEGELQDAEVAIAQLTELKEMQAKSTLVPLKTPPVGRASQQRGVRNGLHRISGSGGRAVSESGAAGARGRPRTSLTADPPPPPVAGARARRSSTLMSGPVSTSGAANGAPAAGPPPSTAAVRTALQGRKGGAGGSDALNGGSSASALVPTLSPLRTSNTSSGQLNHRPSVSGGSMGVGMLSSTPPGNSRGPIGNLLAASPTPQPNSAPLSLTANAPAQATSPTGRPSPRDAAKPLAQNNTVVVRQTFLKDSQEGPSGNAAGGTGSLPPVNAASRVAQVMDLTTVALPSGFEPPSEAPNIYHLAAQSVENTNSTSMFRSKAAPVQPDTIPNGAARSGSRNWGVSTDPTPPTGAAPGARRPLGPLSISSPSPLGGLQSQNSGLLAAGAISLSGAAGAEAAAGAGGGPGMSVLVEEGETVEQALARWSVAVDDIRGSLVDTARQFRHMVDLCNGAWADQRWWLAAHTHEDAAADWWPASDAYVVNRAEIVRCLKAGAVAFQFMCSSDDPLVGPSGNRFDWWTSDPWEVAADLVPDKASELRPHMKHGHGHGHRQAHGEGGHERLVGMPLGVRVLQQLANSVAEVAGPHALESLPIILHISERQQEAIAADLLQYGIYRRLRRNLYLVVQKTHPVMRYSPEDRAFTPAANQPWYTPGTGYSMLQLLWPGHALHLNDSGELERLPHSLMQELKNRNTEWFVSRNGQDLSLLLDDGALDTRSLSHFSYLWNTPHLRYSLAVETCSSLVKHRDMIAYHGSVLLCRKPKVSGMVVGRLDGAVRVDRYAGGTKPQLPVVELMACELNSAHMQHELTQIGATRAAAASVGLGRYYFRFEVLAKMLTGPTVLRPKLYPVVDLKAAQANPPGQPRRPPTPLSEPTAAPASDAGAGSGAQGGPVPPGAAGAMMPFPPPGGLTESQLAHAASQGMDTVLLKLHFSMTDLTMHHASKVVALKTHRPPIYVRGSQDGQRLVELLHRSDQDLREAGQRLAAKLPSFSRQQKPGQNILVFVQDNSVSLTATNVAAGLVRRERSDRIHLVTTVPTDAQRGEGATLLERFMKAFRTHADVTTHVLSTENRGMLECVADVVTTHRCGLLITGSAGITAVAATPPRGGALVLPAATSKVPGTPGGAGRGAASTPGAGGTALGGVDDSGTEMLLSSVALSILRNFSLPVVLVTANTRNFKRNASEAAANGVKPAPMRHAVGGVGGTTTNRLAAMAVVERHSRPMMHHLTRCLLEPSLRQDSLALVQLLPQGLAQGNAGYDPTSIQAVALKTLMTNFESIASANDFHMPQKAYVQGEWQNALCAAARDSGSQLLSVQLAPGSTRSLPLPLLQLIRSAPCPVLIYPERVITPGSEVLTSEDADA